MIYVLDASTGIEIALNNERADFFMTELTEAFRIITSDLYKGETTNVLWKYYKAGYLSKEDALKTLGYCNGIIDDFIDLSSNSEEALVESMRLGHPAYDLYYLTLARRRGGILLTMDKKLKQLAGENGVEILA